MTKIQVHLLAHLSFCNIRNTFKKKKREETRQRTLPSELLQVLLSIVHSPFLLLPVQMGSVSEINCLYSTQKYLHFLQQHLLL